MKIDKKFGFLLAVTGGILWGTYGTFATIMSNMGVDDAAIAIIAPLFLFVFFLLLTLTAGVKKLLVPKKVLPVLLFYGVISAIFNYALVQAYLFLPIGIVSTIVFCNLFLIIIFSYFLFKDPITWKKALASALAVLGIALVLNVFSTSFTFHLLGLFWTLLTMTTWAIMVCCEKYMLVKGVEGNAILMYLGLFSVFFISLFFPPWEAVANFVQTITATGGKVLIPTLAFGFITNVGCYFFYIRALNRIEPAFVQMGYIMDPVTASILGFLVFGQTLLPSQIAGIVLVLGLVAWVQWMERKVA